MPEVIVDSNVAVVESNEEDEEYQHLKLVKSEVVQVPAVVMVRPLSVAASDETDIL